jgi:hypothetical protein
MFALTGDPTCFIIYLFLVYLRVPLLKTEWSQVTCLDDYSVMEQMMDDGVAYCEVPF